MSTIWHPCTEPPGNSRAVRLRFGDSGERDTTGFFHKSHCCYYEFDRAMVHHTPVHPTHWAEIGETAR